MCTALDLPHLFLGDYEADKGYCIKVFRLAADIGMKDIYTVASHIKSISLGDLRPSEIICNQLFFGILGEWRDVILLKEKRIDPAVADTERRQILNDVRFQSRSCVDMNSTSLVYVGQDRSVLKKDFWMANNTL